MQVRLLYQEFSCGSLALWLPVSTSTGTCLARGMRDLPYPSGAALMQVVGLPTLRMSKQRDLVLDGGQLVIPRNTTIWIPLGLPHTSSAVYDKPDQFLPERWLEPDAEYMPANGATWPLVPTSQFCSLLSKGWESRQRSCLLGRRDICWCHHSTCPWCFTAPWLQTLSLCSC